MLDYDHEAITYDASRGGEARAGATAAAVASLLPDGARLVVDVGCGTGLVTARLGGPDRWVAGLDEAAGMLGVAAPRLGGRVARGDARRLPLRAASVDAVVLMWVLHLLDPEDARQIVDEAARVLRPGGVLIITVDKNRANFRVDSDVAAVVGPVFDRCARPQADTIALVTAMAGRHGLAPVGETTFLGHGQGRSPRQWQQKILNLPWVAEGRQETLGALTRALAALGAAAVFQGEPMTAVTILASVLIISGVAVGAVRMPRRSSSGATPPAPGMDEPVPVLTARRPR